MAEALPILSSKPKRKDINKYRELDDEWYSLGTELEIDDEELDELGEKHGDDPHRRMIKVFGVWLEKGETPTYRKLLKALVNIGKRDVAESICTEIGECVGVYYCHARTITHTVHSSHKESRCMAECVYPS